VQITTARGRFYFLPIFATGKNRSRGFFVLLAARFAANNGQNEGDKGCQD